MPVEDPLAWVDLEMTGLDPDHDRILEIAAVVTDGRLDVVEATESLPIHQPEEVLHRMNEWNRRHHGDSGLLERVRRSAYDEQAAEAEVLACVRRHCAPQAAPLAGNTVHQDRRFLAHWMPRLDETLHYRIVDVSTVKELVRRWAPDVFAHRPAKKSAHRALEDIHESIEELRYYHEKVFR